MNYKGWGEVTNLAFFVQNVKEAMKILSVSHVTRTRKH
jgi:hypothetical protein